MPDHFVIAGPDRQSLVIAGLPLRHCRPDRQSPSHHARIIVTPGPDRAYHLCHFNRAKRVEKSPRLRMGSGVGPSGHEGVGAPDAVPPLAPTMFLTSSRTPHPSQLDGCLYRFTLTPVVAIRALARTGRPGYSLFSYAFYRPANPTPDPHVQCIGGHG